MEKKKLVTEITDLNSDFAQWYSDICVKAELMAYSNLQGFIIYLPYGYAIWDLIKAYLDKEFAKTGHSNVYFPMLIAESEFNKEKEHIEGFAPEAAMVTTSGQKDFSERLIIRPTSEILFTQYYAKKIRSHRDLPIKFNQWCSVVRWEKTTRPFLRGKEFLWQEGHTIHKSMEEAKEETLRMLNIYQKMGEELLAIPFVVGRKTKKEKFAGAEDTYSIEALMKDGKALQSGTSHYLGNGFANAFDIKYADQNNQLATPYQTSWGVSTRLIGAVIMAHGDHEGLIIPPYVAPYQVSIIPISISNDDPVISEVVAKLDAMQVRHFVDLRDKSMGYKFADSEMRGIPLRISLGKNELAKGEIGIFKRNTGEKFNIKLTEIDKIPALLKTIHEEMLQSAKDNLNKNTYTAKTYSEFKTLIEKGGYIKMSINEEAEEIIKNETGATARVILDNEPLITKKCPVTKKASTYTVLFARAY